MKNKNILSALAGAMLLIMLMPVQAAYASQQIVTVPTQSASDDPQVVENGVVLGSFGDLGVNLQPPLNDTTTPLDDASLMTPAPNGYTWRFTLPELCNNAELISLRIVTDTVATDEEPVTGVLMGIYGSDDLALFDSFDINNGNGEDGSTWLDALFGTSLPVVDRGAAGTWITVPTFPGDLGMDGTLDANWDISGQDVNEPLGIYIQHWLAGDTATAQTTIQSAQLTYDDEQCSEQTDLTNVDKEAQPTLANTGVNIEIISYLSIAIFALSFMLIIKRNLFVK